MACLPLRKAAALGLSLSLIWISPGPARAAAFAKIQARVSGAKTPGISRAPLALLSRSAQGLKLLPTPAGPALTGGLLRLPEAQTSPAAAGSAAAGSAAADPAPVAARRVSAPALYASPVRASAAAFPRAGARVSVLRAVLAAGGVGRSVALGALGEAGGRLSAGRDVPETLAALYREKAGGETPEGAAPVSAEGAKKDGALEPAGAKAAGADAPAPPAPPAAGPARAGEGGFDRKASIGLFVQRTISISAFIFTSLAYAYVAVPLVGWGGYGALMALGPLGSIAAGPINGIIIDKLSPRNAMLLNTVLKIVFIIDMPIFAAFGALNFGTLLLGSLGNSWLLSSIMTVENSFVSRMAGKNAGTLNGLLWMNYLALQVLLNLVVGVGSAVAAWTLAGHIFTPFYLSSILHALMLPIIFFTIPNTAPGAKAPGQKSPSRGAAARVFVSRYWKEIILFSLAALSFPLLGSPLPIAGALIYWITRSEGFKALRRERKLLAPLLYIALTALMMYPLQYFVMPGAAEALAGKAGKYLLLGQFQGALFFGNLISTAAGVKLPEVRLPFSRGRKVPGAAVVRVVVAALAAAWLYSVFAATPVLGAALGLLAAGTAWLLMVLARRLTQRGWIQLFGLGFAAIWLPFLAWAVPWFPLSVEAAMLIGLLAAGIFYGPAYVGLLTNFGANAVPEQKGKMFGIQSSFFSGAISVGYGLIALAAGFLAPTYPALLAVLGVFYLLGGLLLWRSPRRLSGLPESILQVPPKEGGK